MYAINSKTIVINVPDKFHKYNRVRELRTFSQNQRLKLAAVVNTAVSLHSLANLRASLFLSLVLAGGHPLMADIAKALSNEWANGAAKEYRRWRECQNPRQCTDSG